VTADTQGSAFGCRCEGHARVRNLPPPCRWSARGQPDPELRRGARRRRVEFHERGRAGAHRGRRLGAGRDRALVRLRSPSAFPQRACGLDRGSDRGEARDRRHDPLRRDRPERDPGAGVSGAQRDRFLPARATGPGPPPGSRLSEPRPSHRLPVPEKGADAPDRHCRGPSQPDDRCGDPAARCTPRGPRGRRSQRADRSATSAPAPLRSGAGGAGEVRLRADRRGGNPYGVRLRGPRARSGGLRAVFPRRSLRECRGGGSPVSARLSVSAERPLRRPGFSARIEALPERSADDDSRPELPGRGPGAHARAVQPEAVRRGVRDFRAGIDREFLDLPRGPRLLREARVRDRTRRRRRGLREPRVRDGAGTRIHQGRPRVRDGDRRGLGAPGAVARPPGRGREDQRPHHR
jgi:hypothetical protein